MSNQLTAGQKLTAGQQLVASNGKSHLVMQGADGNLVLYRNDNNTPIFATNAFNPTGLPGNYAIMQTDGNFVVYSAANSALWSTQTSGSGATVVTLGDDGDLVVSTAAGAPVWASNSIQWDFTPSTVAAHAIWPVMTTAAAGQPYFANLLAPGWTFKARLNGATYADAPYGSAQIPSLAMDNETIIHVASMSKPVCITAFVALLDDWQALAAAVKGAGALAASETLSVATRQPPFDPPAPGPAKPPGGPPPPPPPPPPVITQVSVPRWLAPALSSQALAEQLSSAGLATLTPSGLRSVLENVAKGLATCSPTPAILPGYAGLMTQIIKGAAIPTYGDDFLPLIASNLQAKAASLGVLYKPGLGVDKVTLEQVITHNSALRNGITDQSLYTLIPAANVVQPTDGSRVTADPWAYLLAYLSQNADAGTGYKNDDYTVLGGVVVALAGEDYDDYVYGRLFSDPQFSELRRYVTNPAKSAHYYGGLGPGFSGGIPFPDFRGFNACGGFYYTADQITLWLHALYAGVSVHRVTGTASATAPLVSTAGLANLFGTVAYFNAGHPNPISGWTTYVHNGSTSIGSGSTNGQLGVAVAPNGDVMTLFCCANGSADDSAPYNAAFPALVTSAYPPS